MATRVRALIVAKRKIDANRTDDLLEHLNLQGDEGEVVITDALLREDESKLPVNMHFYKVDVPLAVATKVNALGGIVVLASERYDTETGEVSSSNFATRMTAPTLLTLRNNLASLFNIKPEHVQRAAKDVVSAGMSRQEVFDALIERFRDLGDEKA